MIVRNPTFEQELRAEPSFEAGMRAITTAAAASVRQAAPRRTGYYIRKVSPRGTRIVVGDSFWHLVEYGSANNPPYAPLRRGIASAGLRYVPLSPR